MQQWVRNWFPLEAKRYCELQVQVCINGYVLVLVALIAVASIVFRTFQLSCFDVLHQQATSPGYS